MNGRSLRHVDSIVEDEEESGSSIHAPAATSLPSPPSSARMRNTSFTATTTTMTTRPPSDQRLRSISISNVPHPRDKDGISRKASNGPRDFLRQGSQNAAPPPTSMAPGGIQKTRKKQVNLESMDLDDVLAGLDGEEDFVEVRAPVKTASPTDSPRSPGGTKISKNTQDLIAFLDAGPPEEPALHPGANASVISFESSRVRSGRLQRMMSRLTLGGSKESLNGSYNMSEEQPPKTPRTPLSRKNSKMALATSPPPSFKSASLQSKRSIPNVNAAAAYPNVIVATPPPRYSRPPAPPPVSATSSTSTEDGAPSSNPPTLSRRDTRKAVPVLDDAVSPTSSTGHDSIPESRPGSANVNVNGHRVARVYDDSKLSSPPPVHRTPVVNGHRHPVKIDTSESSLRVTSAERKSSHPKAESGYASRSVSRSPVTPSQTQLPQPAAAPTISPEIAEEMRRLLGAATSAEECRLVVDLFLVKSGFPLKEPAPASSTAAAAAGEEGGGGGGADAAKKLEDAIAASGAADAEVERGLVALFLGGDDANGLTSSSRCSSSQSRPRSSSAEQEQEQEQRRSSKSPAPAADPEPAYAPAPATAPERAPERKPEPAPEPESERGRGLGAAEELEQQQQNFRNPSPVSSSH